LGRAVEELILSDRWSMSPQSAPLVASIADMVVDAH
jgi:hypothetical protein